MSPRPNWIQLLLCLMAGVALCMCGKKEAAVAPAGGGGPATKAESKSEPSASSAAAGAAFQKPILEGLQRAGLSVGAFEATAAKPYQARACARGEVARLDVMTCQYDNEQVAEQAKPTLEQFVAGAGTGAIRRSGTVALAVADRTKVDPRGKTLDKLLKTFTSLGVH